MDNSSKSIETGFSFSHPVVSPSGDWIAFYSSRTGRNEIWVLDIEDEEVTQVSDGGVPKSGSWALLWAPDGERLFFEKSVGGERENNIYSVALNGNVEQITDINDKRCILREVSPNNRFLLFTTDKHGQWYLYRHDLHTGETEQLTEIVWSNHIAGFSPDGRRVAFPAPTGEAEQYDEANTARELAVADGDGSQSHVLDVGTPQEEVISRAWHPDNNRLFVTCTGGRATRHGLYDLTDDTVDWFGESDIEEEPVTYLPQKQAFLVVRKRELSSVPRLYPLDGKPYTLDVPEGVVNFPPAISEPSLSLTTGEIVFSHTTPDTPARLLHFDLTTGEYDTYLDSPEVNDGRSFVDATEISYESSDGLEINGLLYDSGKRPSPAVVRVKGGPDGRITKHFNPFVQLLVENGYTVFEPNYRGSEGRGQEFKEMAFGNIGDGDAADVAAAGEWLASRSWIDDKRIAVYGHSHGAYLVYMVMVTYPTLWAAGIAWNGFTDSLALKDEHAAGHAEWLLGEREENKALWRERSPITYVEQIERPILMLHAENDWIPITQARRFRDALEDIGWTAGEEFRYEELSDQGHHSTASDQVERRWQIILEFLEARI